MLRITLIVVGILVSGATILYALSIALGHSASQDTSNSKGPLAADSLKFLIIISRHGNRGSSSDYPGDPYPMNDTRYWPYGADGLTPRGRNEMYNLGVKVRSLYSGFVPEVFRSEDIHASSTYLDRILMSGEAFLAGLYPPKGFQVWNSDLDWQPTAIYSDSPDRTPNLFSSTTGSCKKYTNLFFGVLDKMSTKYGSFLSNISQYVQNATGVNTTSLGSDIGFVLWDKLSNENCEGYALPEWARKIYPEQLLPFATEEYKLTNAGSDESARLVAGEMYEQMLDAMMQKVNGTLTPDMKILYYSGHDTSVIALQRIFGVSLDSIIGMVRPGSALVVELHQNNQTQQHYVQARYIDGFNLEHMPQTLNITADFYTLVNNTQKFIHVNWEKECEETEQNSQSSLSFQSLLHEGFRLKFQQTQI